MVPFYMHAQIDSTEVTANKDQRKLQDSMWDLKNLSWQAPMTLSWTGASSMTMCRSMRASYHHCPTATAVSGLLTLTQCVLRFIQFIPHFCASTRITDVPTAFADIPLICSSVRTVQCVSLGDECRLTRACCRGTSTAMSLVT